MTSRAIRRWVVISAVLTLGGLTYCYTRQPEPMPPPLFDEDDLPPLPDPSADNGWAHLARPGAPSLLIPSLSDDATIVVTELEREELSLDEQWSRWVEAAPQLRRDLEAEDLPASLERWHAAVRAPVFADACPPTMSCKYFQGFEHHQLGLLEVVVAAVDERWADADEHLTRSLVANHGYLASSRTTMGAMVATQSMRRDMAAAAVLLHQQPAEGHHAEARARLLQAVSKPLDYDDIYERAFTGEYIRLRQTLELVEREGPEVVLGDAWWPPAIAYDAPQAAEKLDALFEEWRAGGDPEDPGSAAHWSWFDETFNAIGHLIVSSLMPTSSRESLESTIIGNLEFSQRWRQRLLERWGAPETR